MVHIPLIPALGRQRQANLCEFEASLVYKINSRTARATQRNPVSNQKEKKDGRKAGRQEGRKIWAGEMVH